MKKGNSNISSGYYRNAQRKTVDLFFSYSWILQTYPAIIWISFLFMIENSFLVTELLKIWIGSDIQ